MEKTLPNTGLSIRINREGVLLCGDPNRTVLISNRVYDSSSLGDKGEHRWFVGHYRGFPEAACSQDPSASLGLGLVLIRDAFYQGVDTSERPEHRIMSSALVLAVEMACAALFNVGSLRQIQCGAILTVDGNVLASVGESIEAYNPTQQRVKESLNTATDIAWRAIQSRYDNTQ